MILINNIFRPHVKTLFISYKIKQIGVLRDTARAPQPPTDNIWPKMTKNADFGPNLAVFWAKILIFMGESKSFGTNITEKPPTQKSTWSKIHILGGWSKTFGILLSGNQ